MERLKQQYQKTIIPKLKTSLSFSNVMQVPKITKVVINAGVGRIKEDKKKIDDTAQDLAKITGQAPVRTLAKKSIAGFKTRQNQVVGLKVTLRGERMYAFLDKLINIALPRVKDFRGLSTTGFDGHGSYHLGLREHLVFPEISADAIEHTFGLEISIVTNSRDDKAAEVLLRLMNFPFKQEENNS